MSDERWAALQKREEKKRPGWRSTTSTTTSSLSSQPVSFLSSFLKSRSIAGDRFVQKIPRLSVLSTDFLKENTTAENLLEPVNR